MRDPFPDYHLVDVPSPCTLDQLRKAVADAYAKGHRELRLLAGTHVLEIPAGTMTMDRRLEPGDHLLGILAV